MKKILVIIMSAILLLNYQSEVFAQPSPKNIPVIVNGRAIDFDIQPVEKDKRILVPFRAVAEAIKVNVKWDEKTKTVFAENANTTVKLILNKKTAYVNDKPIQLDVAVTQIKGRTLIPLRVFSEAFGCNVIWDSKLYGARINYPLEALDVVAYYAIGGSWNNLFMMNYPDTAIGHTYLVDELAFGWYSLDSKGNLLTRSKTGWARPNGWEKALEEAQNYKLRTEMVVHLDDYYDTEDDLQQILSSDEATANAVKNIIAEAKLFQGINLDLEGLGNTTNPDAQAEIQKKFTNFVSLLYTQAKGNGLTVSLSLHPPNSAFKGYDFKALSNVSDKIIIMAYQYGPDIEPNNMVVKAVEQSIKLIPQNKLYLGINIPRENAKSLSEKITIAEEYGLKGIALWRLGVISEEEWVEVAKMAGY